MDSKRKVIFIYDFDKTLSPRNMQEFSFQDLIGSTKEQWWTDVNDFGVANNMDNALSMMYTLLKKTIYAGFPLTKTMLMDLGKDIEFYDGVEEFFDRINAYAESLGLVLEHYIISCGLKEIIKGTKIAHNFKKIYGSCFVYDENDVPFWPSHALNYTTKTQYIYRIKKKALHELHSTRGVYFEGEFVDEQPIYDNFVYFGDGETDIPCMSTVSRKGGASVCVFNPKDQKAFEICDHIYKNKRADYLAAADYRENSDLDNICKYILRKIKSYC